MLKRDDKLVCLPSHGENRGSSPLGSANDFNKLDQDKRDVSNGCPIHGRARESSRLSRAAAELVSPTIDPVIDSAASCGPSDYESGGRRFESFRARQ